MPRGRERYDGDPTQVQSRDDRMSSRLSKRASAMLGAAGWSSSEQQELSIMFAQQRRNKHGDLPLSDVATLLEKLGVEREALSAVGLSLGGLARALDTRGRAREAGAVGVDDFCLGLAFLDPLTDAAALWRATDGWGEHTRAMVLRAFDADNDGALAWKEWPRVRDASTLPAGVLPLMDEPRCRVLMRVHQSPPTAPNTEKMAE